MLIYRSDEHNPYRNLAAEEFLLENIDGDVLTLWINEPAVIIGKNQNAFAEVNQGYLDRNGIKLVRRLTGGGAVFHDLGNICFTFITDATGDIDFGKFVSPVTDALGTLGLNAEISGRNDITVDGMKVSGNAQCHYRPKKHPDKTRVLHHGTLLYDSDISMVADALKVNPLKLKSKGISSVRSRVCNIRSIAKEKGLDCASLETGEMMKYLEGCLAERFSCTPAEYSQVNKAEIRRLADEKYSLWEYNYGSSKAANATYGRYFPFGYAEAAVDTEGGTVMYCGFSGDFFGVGDVSELGKHLVGCRFAPGDVEFRLKTIPGGIGKYIFGASEDDILELFFGNTEHDEVLK